MKFDDVKSIFYQHIPRRYHRFCRELYAQLVCVQLTIKPAYLFDLFPYSLEAMRHLLDSLALHLPFRAVLLKYSVNDVVIVNSAQLSILLDSETSPMLIDLMTMSTMDSHPMLDQVRQHLRWIDERQHERVDFDDELHADWAALIQPLNHTTVFGYVLGYPLVYFHSLAGAIDVSSLDNYRLYVNVDGETLLYSFSCPIHVNIDPSHIDSVVQRWFSSLALRMSAIKSIKDFRLDKETREESAWCL